MSEKINVAEQVKAGAKRLEWLVRLADELEKTGSLEQAQAETERAIDVAKGQLHAVGIELKETKELVAVEQERVGQLNKQAQEVLTAARVEAEQIVLKAREEAKERLASADEAVKAADETAAASVDTAKKVLADANEQLSAVNAEIERESATLAGLRRQIEETKVQAAGLFRKFTSES